MFVRTLSLVALAACLPALPPVKDTAADDTDDTTDTDTATDTDANTDADADGYSPAEGDCDDAEADVNPAAEERWYDGVDQDCDGDDCDRDGDAACVLGYDHPVPEGFVAGDCWDDASNIPTAFTTINGFSQLGAEDVRPGAIEVWYDGVDQDCAGDGDFDQDADGQATDGYPDRDGAVGPDCDDTNAARYEGASDTWYDGVDGNCRGDDDFDQDGDGHQRPEDGGRDCDDTRSSVHPGVEEDCATVYDDDCDESVDALDAAGCAYWYIDADADGYGDPVRDPACWCEAPIGYAGSADDCDDDDAGVSPGATEVCDAADADEDCDGLADDADSSVSPATTTAWYADADGDGHGSGASVGFCDATGGYVGTDGDCDDTKAGVNPDVTEICRNGLDDDCDGGPGSCVPADGSLLDADAIYTGTEADEAGIGVAFVGDPDADGYDDFLVGAFLNDDVGDQAGAAYLVRGSPTPSGGALIDEVTLSAERAFDRAGYAVAGVGDTDGDSFDDFVIGSYDYNETMDGQGATWLVLGASSQASASLETAVVYEGWQELELTSFCLSGAGDVDGDGLADFLVGTYDIGSNLDDAGAAYLVRGDATPSDTTLEFAVRYTGELDDDYAGNAVAGVGDTDGDGLDDIAVGAMGQDAVAERAGAAYLVLGSPAPASGELSAHPTFVGEAAEDLAGVEVAGVGDFDGDGYPDIAVGAPYNDDAADNAGTLYIVAGTASPADVDLATVTAFTGEAVSDELGYLAAAAGDVDGDGFDDLYVTARGNDEGGLLAGAVYLIYGDSASGSTAGAVQLTGAPGDRIADALSAGGDVNGDGLSDLLVGTTYNSDSGALAGAAYLVLGTGL